jgi:hypothetical protein
MTNSITSKFFAAALPLLAGSILFAIQPAGASTMSELNSCSSFKRSKTVECCETVISHASSSWKQRLSGKNCASSVRCGRRGGNRSCYVLLEEVQKRPVRKIRIGEGGEGPNGNQDSKLR